MYWCMHVKHIGMILIHTACIGKQPYTSKDMPQHCSFWHRSHCHLTRVYLGFQLGWIGIHVLVLIHRTHEHIFDTHSMHTNTRLDKQRCATNCCCHTALNSYLEKWTTGNALTHMSHAPCISVLYVTAGSLSKLFAGN